jgi:hypothetical protein
MAAISPAPAAVPPPVVDKHVSYDIDSVYDEEVIATKESDFRRKQVSVFGAIGVILITTANGECRNSRDGQSCGCPTRQLESSTATLGR